MKNSRALIQVAEKKLLETPFDIGHDIHHHYNVWKNCYFIASLEDLTPDMEKLEIAAWWHDYDKKDNKHNVLIEEMKRLEFNEEYIQSVIELINSHSFNDERSDTVEGKTLFDADKIEYISPDRFLWIGEGILDELLDLKTAKLYGKAVIDRIDYVMEALNYNSSKKLFVNNFKLYLELLEKQKDRYKTFLESIYKEELDTKYKELSAKIANTNT